MQTKRVQIAVPLAKKGAMLDWDTETIELLVKRACEVVQCLGLRLVEDREGKYLQEMERRGVKVDWQRRVVLFEERHLLDTMAALRKSKEDGGEDGRKALSDQAKGKGYCVGNGANLLFDFDAWQVRSSDRDSFVELLHWTQGCEDVSEVFTPCTLGDVDQRLAPMYSYALMGGYCRKPFYHEQPTDPLHVKYLDEMARVVEAERGFYQPMQEWEWINPPLTLGGRSIETMLARLDQGACESIGVGTMAVRGMTAPVTIGGLAVMGLAEILAGLTFFNVLRPNKQLKSNACTGVMDLRTGRVSYGGVSVHLQNMAIWELLVRGIGAEAHFCTWYRDANEPGMQALYEFGLNQTFFSTVYERRSVEIGGLACGGSFSPEQAVLDMAAVKEFDELMWGYEISEELLGVEEILNAGFDSSMHMTSDHTLSHMRSSGSWSQIFRRGLPANASHSDHFGQSKTLLTDAADAVKIAKMKGQEVERDNRLAKALGDCVNAAATELGIDERFRL